MKNVTVFASGKGGETSGPATITVSIVDEKEESVTEFSESIGNADKSYAGYFSVLRAMQTLEEKFGAETRDTQYEFKLDDEMIVKQLNIESEISEPGIVPLFIEIHNRRVISFPKLTVTYKSA